MLPAYPEDRRDDMNGKGENRKTSYAYKATPGQVYFGANTGPRVFWWLALYRGGRIHHTRRPRKTNTTVNSDITYSAVSTGYSPYSKVHTGHSGRNGMQPNAAVVFYRSLQILTSKTINSITSFGSDKPQ